MSVVDNGNPTQPKRGRPTKNYLIMATLSQIEKALNNTFVFGIDGTEELYNKIRITADNTDTTRKIGDAIPGKTPNYYSKSDWKKVYSVIKSEI